MNIPVPADSSEPFKSNFSDFLTAFNLSFYTQLAEVANNPKAQVYRIGLGTLATAHCFIQVGELTDLESNIDSKNRSFSILLHVGLNNVQAAKSLCEIITEGFLKTSYKSTLYELESIRKLPKWSREIVTEYPVAFRINGLIPQESTQEILYNVLEIIALQWVELGNLAKGARGFLGNDQQNQFQKPKWKVPIPDLVESSIRGKVTQDVALTIASIINPTEQLHVLVGKYDSTMARVQSAVKKLSWRGFNTESSEVDKWSHLQILLEEFIPFSVAHWILSGKHWDHYVLETGNKGIRNVTITLFDTQNDFGRSIAEWERRIIQFTWEGNSADRDKLVLAWASITDSDIDIPWNMEMEIDIGSSLNIGEQGDVKLSSIFTVRLSQQEVSTFKQTINVIIQILHFSGFPLGDTDTDSHSFGFLKLGANENGWIQGEVQRDRHRFNRYLTQRWHF